MNHDIDFLHKPELPASITVICLAEAAAPADSLIWMLADRALAEIGRRIEVMGLPIQAPEPLKMRSLSPRVKKLLATAGQVVLIAGLRMDNQDEPVIHHTHRAGGTIIQLPGAAFDAGKIVTDQTVSDQLLFARQTPKPWIADETIPLINTLISGGEAMALPVWLEDDLPSGGFDFLGIPLPAAESCDWLLPQLGGRFPEVTQALTDILWPLLYEKAPPQADESAG